MATVEKPMAEPSFKIRHVLLPADLREDATPAFALALRIVLNGQGTLNIVHATGSTARPHWSSLPGVRPLLVKWGVLGPDATVTDFERLNVQVHHRVLATDRPVGALVDESWNHPTDLIVMMSHERTLVERWLQGNVGETVARRARTRTLFVPESANRTVVHPVTGHPHFHKILVPVADTGGQAAVHAAVALGEALGAPRATGILLHVGTNDSMPSLRLPDGWSWQNQVVAESAIVPAILNAADRDHVDLIVMASRGHDGLLDMLRGSTTERVLHAASCPVLMAPLPEVVA